MIRCFQEKKHRMRINSEGKEAAIVFSVAKESLLKAVFE